MDRRIDVKWHGREDILIKSIKNYKENGLLSDCTIACAGREFKTHQLILSMSSDYFYKIFTTAENGNVLIVLPDIDPVHFEIILQYIYIGECNISLEILNPIIKLASQLQIKNFPNLNDLGINDHDVSNYYGAQSNYFLNRHFYESQCPYVELDRSLDYNALLNYKRKFDHLDFDVRSEAHQRKKLNNLNNQLQESHNAMNKNISHQSQYVNDFGKLYELRTHKTDIHHDEQNSSFGDQIKTEYQNTSPINEQDTLESSTAESDKETRVDITNTTTSVIKHISSPKSSQKYSDNENAKESHHLTTLKIRENIYVNSGPESIESSHRENIFQDSLSRSLPVEKITTSHFKSPPPLLKMDMKNNQSFQENEISKERELNRIYPFHNGVYQYPSTITSDISPFPTIQVTENYPHISHTENSLVNAHQPKSPDVAARIKIRTINDPLLKRIRTHRKQRERGPKIWEFLLRLLNDPNSNPILIKWENKEEGIFKLIQPNIIAERWGQRTDKHAKESLTYENFARGLRYHYYTGALKAVSEKCFVYRFGPKADGALNKQEYITSVNKDL